MAYVATELFRQEFTSTDFVIVNHNQDIEYPAVRLLVNNDFRPDLIETIFASNLQPTDRLAVKLRSVQSGVVQILNYDFQPLGVLSATTLVNLGLGATFVLGENYSYAEDLAASSTNSTTFVQKLRLSVVGVPDGRYHVGTSFTWNMSSTTDDFAAQLQIDDTDTPWSMMEEHSDSSADQEVSGQGLAFVDLTAGNHDIDLDFSTDNAVSTARISQARIEFWRLL